MSATLLQAAFASHRAGNLEAAIGYYRDCLAADASQSAVYDYLGVACTGLPGRGPEAVHAFRRSLLLEPGRGSVLSNLATLYVHATDDPRALLWFRRASKTEALRADYWARQASCAIRLGQNAEALTCLKQACLRAPADPAHWEHLGTLLRRMTRRADAERCVRDGLLINPGAGRLLSSLSATLLEMDTVAAAIQYGRMATIAAPADSEAFGNLAQAFYRSGRIDAAISNGAQAMRFDPQNPTAALNLAIYLLTNGDLARGWSLYEARLIPLRKMTRNLPPQRWTPDVSGPDIHLLVYTEQGLGDEVMFATCFPELQERLAQGALGSVTIECTDRLRALFERSFPEFRFFDRIRKQEQRLHPADYAAIVSERGCTHEIATGSLPKFFRPDHTRFLDSATILIPDPDKVAHWKHWLSEQGTGPWIGLSWRSRANRDLGAVYYPGPQNLAPVLTIPGARFVTLQYDDDPAELTRIETENTVRILRPPGLDLTNDLDGVSALIAALDAVVSPQNLVLSLTGALGKTGYSMPHVLNWVSLGSGRMPFFPSITVDIRRGNEGLDWQPVMQRLAGQLRADLSL
ncbi:tetratricopeptide repeat protein [uncultured Nisaea sp.]|uniref:tetratricopeptide repeat protein n=1 Tax=uncultured Nisaea sp. TaxID=538215 RepID=UPI0030EEB639|tara:strand:- start:597 stop:2327 length:1731 start_codon:yes stop_codon:yes gene_type:complete